MKWGGKRQSSTGFTIIETLIVLAVTAALFLVAALAVSGRQNKTDFQVGARTLQTDIQRIINETASGHFPRTDNFRCTVSGGTVVFNYSASNEQGTNSDCIIGGRVLVFSADTPEDYSVYTLAGRRLAGGLDVKSAEEAGLKVVRTATVTDSLSNGLTYIGTDATSTNGLALVFLSNFANFAQGAAGQTGGVQTLALHELSAPWPINTSSDAGEAFINLEYTSGARSDYPPATSDMTACFKSAGTDQSALLTISPSLTVTVDIKNGTSC